MADKYCVFWYPTIFHNELTPIKDFATLDFVSDLKKRSVRKDCYIYEDEISDNIGKTHNVRLRLDKETKHLFIESRIGESGDTVLELKYIDSRRNGLALYSYSYPTENSEYKFIEYVLKEGIYHLAKSFYHSHELKNGSDAVLHAYIINVPINLKENDNAAIIHFLALYEKKFKKYAKSISDDFAYLESIKNDKAELEKTWSTRSRKLNEFCENALIEYVYCKTLFESKYNKLIRVGIVSDMIDDPETLVEYVDPKLKKEDLYKIALNIENSIRYIKYIQKKNWNILDSFSTDITHAALRLSKRSGDVSIVLGIISALLGILSVYLAFILKP